MPSNPAAPRRLVGVVMLVVASLAVALLAGELLVRATWFISEPAHERSLERLRTANRERRPRPDTRGLEKLESPRLLARKNVRGLYKGVPFRTNSSGFRGPDTSAEPPPGVFRVVILGDSVTMGSGVAEGNAYPARLAERLNRGGGERRYEVLNLGLAGSNARQVVRRLEDIGLAHHPDLLVYGYTLNDIEGPVYESTMKRGSVKAMYANYGRFSDSSSYLLRAVWPRWLSLRDLLIERPGTWSYDVQHNYFENPAAWGAVLDEFDRLAELASEAGVCVHLLIHTGIAQLNRLYPFLRVNARIEEAARARGFTVTQTYPYYRGRDPNELRISFFDTHPNAAGHAIIAEALQDGLRELPPECWRSPAEIAVDEGV